MVQLRLEDRFSIDINSYSQFKKHVARADLPTYRQALI